MPSGIQMPGVQPSSACFLVWKLRLIFMELEWTNQNFCSLHNSSGVLLHRNDMVFSALTVEETRTQTYADVLIITIVVLCQFIDHSCVCSF